MKTSRINAVLLTLLLTAAAALHADASSNLIALTGAIVLSGGQASGGDITLVGSASPLPAVRSEGGGFVLTSATPAVSTTALPDLQMPELRIHLVPNAVELSWPTGSTTVVLEVTSDAATAEWVQVQGGVSEVDGLNRLRLDLPDSHRFYRLRVVP